MYNMFERKQQTIMLLWSLITISDTRVYVVVFIFIDKFINWCPGTLIDRRYTRTTHSPYDEVCFIDFFLFHIIIYICLVMFDSKECSWVVNSNPYTFSFEGNTIDEIPSTITELIRTPATILLCLWRTVNVASKYRSDFSTRSYSLSVCFNVFWLILRKSFLFLEK